MIVTPLRLTRSAIAVRPTSAWFVPGHNTTVWLHEAAQWNQPLAELVFLPLGDGALVVSPNSSIAAGSSGGIPYGAVAERVYAPIDAEVIPPLTIEEWRETLADPDAWYVWRPGETRIRFDSRDVLRATDLVMAPPPATTDWSQSVTAPFLGQRLKQVVSSDPPLQLDDIVKGLTIEQAPPGSLHKLPPAPNEPPRTWAEFAIDSQEWFRRRTAIVPTSLKELATRFVMGLLFLLLIVMATYLVLLAITLLQLIAGPIDWRVLTRLAPLVGVALWSTFLQVGRQRGSATSTAPASDGSQPSAAGGWLKAGWGILFSPVAVAMKAAGAIHRMRESVDGTRRNREVQRLLHMLETDPELGLRYAIPMVGDEGRGTGPISNQLVDRGELTHWQPSTGGADVWTIRPDQQFELNRRYRQLAEREQARGRHRKAAQIYSRLLGDWQSAALALAAGSHFEAAATIHLEKLNNKTQAAQLFERAGRFDRALTLYTEQRAWLAAGDLCQRIGQAERAHFYYAQDVQDHQARGNLFQAADTLERKLNDVTGALDLLKQSWPTNHEADRLLEKWFQVAAKHHRHDEARARIDELATGAWHIERAKRTLRRLADVRQSYPDNGVASRAQERIWSIVSQHLPSASVRDTRELTTHLATLAPRDQLLARDCQRFVERRRTREPLIATRPRGRSTGLRLVHRCALLPRGEPLTYALAGVHGWATIIDGTHPQLVLTPWIDDRPGMSLINHNTRLIAIDDQRGEIWIDGDVGELRLNWFGDSRMYRVHRPVFIPHQTLVVRTSPTKRIEVLWLDEMGAAWWTMYTADGRVMRPTAVAKEIAGSSFVIDPTRAALERATDDGRFFVLPLNNGGMVIEQVNASGERVWIAELPPGRATLPPTPGDAWLCLSMADHCALFTTEGERETPILLPNWSNAAAAFLPGDLLALADDQRVAAYSTTGDLIAEFAHEDAEVIAIADPGEPGRVALLRADRTTEIWELAHDL